MLIDDAMGSRPVVLTPARIVALAGALSLVVFAAACVSVALPRDGFLAPVWLANAFVLAVLSVTRPRHWPIFVIAGVIGNMGAQALGHVHLAQGACFAISNVSEELIAALILRIILRARPDFSRPLDLMALAIAAVSAGGFGAILSATALFGLSGLDIIGSVRTWVLAHSLGLLTVTPCLLIISGPKQHLGGRKLDARAGVAAFLLLATTVGVFAQTRFPILFLIPPVLLLVSLELETFGAAAGVLTVEVIALASLFTHTGPMMLVRGDGVEKAAVVQIFLFASLISSLPVAALNARRREIMAALAKSEMRYRRLADNASDIVTEADLSGRFSYVSPAVLAMTGYRHDEIVGRQALGLIHPDDVDRVKREIVEALKSPTGKRIEHRHIRKDGDVIWVESRPTLARDPKTGAPLAITDVMRDISERKAMELQLGRARLDAEAATAAKGEFLANMSHELRTPLTSILGFSGLLRDQSELSDLSRHFLGRIDGSGQALLAIVNDILNFSKMEAGQVDINRAPLELHDFMSETLTLLKPQADFKGLDLIFLADQLPALAMCDAARVRQVLMNMVGNAVKFTASGSVTLAASYELISQRLRCEITDTGEGVSEEGLARLFQRFSQVDASTTRVHGGTGLGLAICKGLVQAMGGEIGARSVLGEGSCFWFELPCALTDAQPQGASSARNGGADLNGVRILVADPNRINREIIRLMLSPLGVELTDAQTGETAIQAAHEAPFDLILMDHELTDADGTLAAHVIRTGSGPNDSIPILALADDGPHALPGMKKPEVFEDLIERPIAPARLIAAITCWTQSQAVQAEALYG